MSPFVAFAAALLALSGVQPDTAPASRADEVVVKARKTVVVVANVCPAPDPVRYRAEQSPRVLDSHPAQGGVTAPGFVRVRVSFDAPMSCFSEVTSDGGESDPCQPDGTWELPGRRSFVMQCRLEPSTDYRMRFRRAEGQGFVGLSGRPAEPFDLSFSTSSGPSVTSPEQAVSLDPGAPGERGVSAYVICGNRPSPAGRRDCQRTMLIPPAH
ncbi:hypothetical protein [Caulobacter sp. S45]|uniref:hypothetical protein n=1 Tax=Caulobacter sp. S45 TaxID=1641861 RepID=UPI00157763A4|nr:hypothetical protein [Caulobacter sp. S45]